MTGAESSATWPSAIQPPQRDWWRPLILAADGLASFSWRGRRGLAPDTRELAAAPPYLLVYEVDEAAGTVSILRVWQGAQDW